VLVALPVLGGGQAQAGYVSVDALNEPASAPLSAHGDSAYDAPGTPLLAATAFWAAADADDPAADDLLFPNCAGPRGPSVRILKPAPLPARTPEPVPTGNGAGEATALVADPYRPAPPESQLLALSEPLGRPSRLASGLFRPPR
jgi:hypothetical protein